MVPKIYISITVCVHVNQRAYVLISELKKYNVKPNKIKYLICTHGHIDHIGNLNLFPDAVIILDSSFGYKPGFYGKHVRFGEIKLCIIYFSE